MWGIRTVLNWLGLPKKAAPGIFLPAHIMARKRKGLPSRLNSGQQVNLAWRMCNISEADHTVKPDTEQLVVPNQAARKNDGAIGSNRNALAQLSPRDVEELERMLGHINKTSFCVKVQHKVQCTESNWHCILGTFQLSFPQPNGGSHGKLPDTLPNNDFWFYGSSEPNQQLVYVECEDVDLISNDNSTSTKLEGKRVMYFLASAQVPWKFLEALKWKGFLLEVARYDATSGTLELCVLGTHMLLMELQFSCEAVRHQRWNAFIQHIMAELHGFKIKDYGEKKAVVKPDIIEFYAAVKARQNLENLQINKMVSVQHPNLRPRLREYQKDAVRWMLHRERSGAHRKTFSNELHCLYDEIFTPDGKILYYNKYGGFLVKDRPLAMMSPPGGILADEMGLGKTVEVLATLMSNPCKNVPTPEELPIILPIEEYSSNEEDCEEDDWSKGLWDAGQPFPSTSKYGLRTKQYKNYSSAPIIKSIRKRGKQSAKSVKNGISKTRNGANSDSVILADHIYCQQYDANKNLHEDVKPEKTQAINAASARTKPGKIKANKITKKTKGKISKSSKKKAKIVSIEENKESEITSTESDGSASTIAYIDQSSPSLALTPMPDYNDDSWITLQPPKSKKKRNAINTDSQDVGPMNVPQDSGETPTKLRATFECVCGLKSSTEAETDERRRVQCLACGLWQHPDCVKYDLTNPLRGPYLCPHCRVLTTPVPSGATLIISPNSICHQWADEIRKHIHQARLKVLMYKGVQVHGFLQPQFIAQHDIVITSYETLQKEMPHVDLPHSNSETGRRFRQPKRFMAIPSPIIAVEWWRVCLDEAQMVECTTTKSAEMALRLCAVNRWCVTGTPIQKGLEDLYGLFRFLGEDPYWVRSWWNSLLNQPFAYGDKAPMYEAMAKVMWRTCKADVLDQIGLPMQAEEIHWLTFSPIEEHFYKRTFSQCAQVGLASLSKWQDSTTKLNSVDRYTLHALLSPLTKIRQACCHPQAVRGSFLPLPKSALTMEELLVSMTRKARVECEEAHRQLNAAINGIAGLHIIKHEYVQAVDLYRDVLRSVVQHSDEFRTDPFQHLHTLHNLAEVLALRPTEVSPTLRDDKLKDEAKELRHKYLLKAATFVQQAEASWAPLSTSIRELKVALRDGEDWWSDLLRWVIDIGQDESFIERIKTELVGNKIPGTTSIATRFRDILGLEYVIASELDLLDSAHEGLIDILHRLQGETTQEVIDKTVTCCLRPGEIPGIPCPFCKANELFDIYENKLFAFKDKNVSEVSGLKGESNFQIGVRRQGTWADSETERILKCLISFVKGFGGTPTHPGGKKLTELGSIHLKLLEAFKKEFKVIRTLWIELRAQVSAHDELDMATMRLRLRFLDEPITNPPQPNVVERAELDSQWLKVQSDRIINQNLLQKKMGQLMYLKNLAKRQTVIEGGENQEQCPICQRTLGQKWAVLSCGHWYCLDCLRVLTKHCFVGGQNVAMKCPMCRQGTRCADISYVTISQDEAQQETSIKGDHSTKVQGMVTCVLNILQADPTSKILIFTSWLNVLSIIAKALSDNDVNYLSLLANNKYQRNLSNFKTLDYINVLLLPVHSGSNGLNLVEATHVLLVEPILNYSQELQAIGRVHRIGQTKPTFVHRFLIQGTIEEYMHNLITSRGTPVTGNSNKADDTPFTVGDLKALYLHSQLCNSDMNDAYEHVPTITPSDAPTTTEQNDAQAAEEPV